MKKVLIIAASLKIGGAEKVARDISLYSPAGQYAFHYLVFGDAVGAYEAEVQNLGHKVIHFHEPSDNYPEYFCALLKLMKRERYHIVHAHNMFNCGITMLAAKLAGIPVRISHAHSALDNGSGFVKKVYEKVMRSLILHCGTDYIACGVAAGHRLFGKRAFEQKGSLILNGIDVPAFAYNPQARDRIRGEYAIHDRFVLGHAGHLAAVKNQSFLLELLPQILESVPDALLFLLGEGEDRPMLEQKIRDMQLEDHVIVTGNVSNVSDYLSAMDVFVFPSLYEGMPLALLEVQANGLPCIVSNSVPEDVFLTDLIHPLPLEARQEQWAERILDMKRNNTGYYNRLLRDSEYSAEKAMAKIYSIYEKGTPHD